MEYVYIIHRENGDRADRKYYLSREDAERAAKFHYVDGHVREYVMCAPPPEFGTIEDGHGSCWVRCKADCGLHVVRPGKVQCECDYADGATG